MAIAKDTSAGRLWNVLHEAKLLADSQTKQFQDFNKGSSEIKVKVEAPTVKSVFSAVLDPNDLYRSQDVNDSQKLGFLFDLMSDVEHDLRLLHRENAKFYFGPISRLRLALLTVGFDRNWREFSPYLEDGVMDALALMAYSLRSTSVELEIGIQELTDLSEKVNALIETVLKSSINGDLKSVLLRHLQELFISIANYRVTGSAGIKTSSEAMCGAILLAKDEVKTDDEKQTIKDTIVVLDIALKLVGWSCKAYNMIAPGFGFPTLPAL